MVFHIAHVNIRRMDRYLIGVQKKGLRLWQRSGNIHELRSWYEGVLCVCYNGAVEIGFAARFVGVTTQTVRARMRSGGLTVFEFRLTGTSARYRFVPFCEVEHWQRLRMQSGLGKKARKKS
jgi:hypothetical protein